MKRIALALAVLALVALLGAAVALPRLLTAGRLAETLAGAIGEPVRVGKFEVGMSPLQLVLGDLRIGTEPPWLAVDNAEVVVDRAASISELRPVLRVKAVGVRAVLLERPRDSAVAPSDNVGGDGQGRVPIPIRIAQLEIRDASLRFEMGDDPARVEIASLTASALLHRSGELTDLSLALENGWLRSQQQDLELRAGEIHGRASAAGLFLDSGRASGPKISVTAVRDPLLAERLRIEGTFDLPLIGVFVDGLHHLTGAARAQGFLEGNVANPRAEIELQVRDGAIAGRPVGDLSTRMTRDGYDMHFEAARVSGGPGELLVGAQLDFRGHGVRLTANATAIDVDMSGLMGALQVPLAFEAVRYRGAATVSGELDPLELQIQTKGDVLPSATGSVVKARPAVLSVDATARPDGVRLTLALEQAGANKITGQVELGEQLSASFDADSAELASIAALAPFPVPSLGLSGALRAKIIASGPAPNPRIEVRAQASGLAWGTARLDTLFSDVVIENETMALRELKATSGAGTLRLDGRIGLTESAENDWRVTLDRIQASAVYGAVERLFGVALPLTEGSASGRLEFRQRWQEPSVQGEVRLIGPRLWHEPLRELRAKIDVRGQQVELSAEATRKDEEQISLVFSQGPSAPARVSVRASDLRFETDSGEPGEGVSGLLSIEGDLRGPWARANGTASARIHHLVNAGTIFPDVSVQATCVDGTAKFRVSSPDARLAGDGSLRLQAPFPLRFDGRWQGVWFEDRLNGDSIRGEMTAEAHLETSLSEVERVSGRIGVEAIRLSRGDYAWSLRRPVEVQISAGRLRWRGAELVSSDSTVALDGDASIAGALDATVQGSASLTLLELWPELIASARGRSDFNLHIVREPAGPWRITGGLKLESGQFDFGGPIAPSAVRGQLRFSGKNIAIDDLSGALGGGRFSVGGSLDLDEGPRLSWIVEKVGVNLIDDLEAQLSGKGAVAGSWSAPLLAGDIEILRAVYDRDVGLADLFPIIRDKLVGKRTQRRSIADGGLGLDLIVHSPGDLFLDNNLAKVEGAARLRVTGPMARPRITGAIRILDGEVELRRHTFTLTGGSIELRDPLVFNPLLSISAESRISTPQGDYTINASVGGSAEDPRILFTSDDPTLTQNDILSLVAFGRTAADLQRGGGGVTAMDALALVPTGPLEKRLGDLVGVDEFEIRAIEQEETGRVEPQIKIGKRLTNRIHASVATSVGVQSRRSVELEYDLTRRISLIGSWEEEAESDAGAFGGAIKFRYEFRRSPFSILRQVIADRRDDAAPDR